MSPDDVVDNGRVTVEDAIVVIVNNRIVDKGRPVAFAVSANRVDEDRAAAPVIGDEVVVELGVDITELPELVFKKVFGVHV